MSVWQNILNYYLDSEKYFLNNITLFYENYDLIGKCGVGYNFESQIYNEIENRRLDTGFWTKKPYSLVLDDRRIQEYFITAYSETQLFAVIFAHWCGLSEFQINKIKDKRLSRSALDLLNYFICNRNIDVLQISKSELQDYKYSGEYYININGQTVTAFREEHSLIDKVSGDLYKIE